MKKMLCWTAGALMAATTATAEVKIALDSQPDLERSGSYVWSHAFVNAVRDSGIEIRELPQGAIGSEDEVFDQLSTGLLEVALSDIRAAARIDPFAYGLRLPYLLDDAAHLERTLTQTDFFTRVNEGLAPQDVRLLSVVPLGPPSGFITTSAEIRSPDDMSGLRLRALDEAQLAMYAAWGASGTIVSWGDIMSAMQTGVVDGYLNSPFVPLTFGQTDVVRHFSDAAVIIPLRGVMVSRSWYDGLPDDQRAAVDEAVITADEANRDWLDKVSVSALDELEAAGVTVQRLDDDQRAAFRELSLGVSQSGLLPDDQAQIWVAAADQTR